MQCRRAELSIGAACAVGLCDDPGLDALAGVLRSSSASTNRSFWFVLLLILAVSLSGPLWLPYTGVTLPASVLVITSIISCAFAVVVFVRVHHAATRKHSARRCGVDSFLRSCSCSNGRSSGPFASRFNSSSTTIGKFVAGPIIVLTSECHHPTT